MMDFGVSSAGNDDELRAQAVVTVGIADNPTTEVSEHILNTTIC